MIKEGKKQTGKPENNPREIPFGRLKRGKERNRGSQESRSTAFAVYYRTVSPFGEACYIGRMYARARQPSAANALLHPRYIRVYRFRVRFRFLRGAMLASC